MIFYLNQGFIVEQALVDIVKRYFKRLHLDSMYENFHISITNNHPFAHLIIHQDSQNVADIFPSIVITTTSDSKNPEMMNMPPQITRVALTKSDLEALTKTTRIKKDIDHNGNEYTVTKRDGSVQTEQIPGFCYIAEESVINTLLEEAENKDLLGVCYLNTRRDKISLEIWSENNQLKNELYENLRVFLETSALDILESEYKIFSPVISDQSISGERSNNFNFDFDVPLYGARIAFDIDYVVRQFIIDTDATDIKTIVLEVLNRVKVT